jgi:peptidoglycan/xylan/chitin deacetylase (PgdA/CDA1 family)
VSVDGLKITFLIGKDDAATQAAIAAVCELSGVRPVAVLLDSAAPGKKQRWRNLKRNISREGLFYVVHRAISAVREKLEDWADRAIRQDQVEELLRQAFPERGLDRIAQKYGFEVWKVGNLNGALAAERLRASGADLGVVLGTRILKPVIFQIPPLGCVNLHKGKVPDYRGMPPGFWELYDGQASAGVTVHFIDAGLDTGDVLGTAEVPIHPKETPESLRAKLDHAGVGLLAQVVAQLQNGTAHRQPQVRGAGKTKTRPTRAQQQELARRLQHWRRQSDLRQLFKTALYLALFHGGVYSLVRWARRRRASRGAIILYHRVNDVSTDVLTTSTRRFSEHLVALRRYYTVVPTTDLVDLVDRGERIKPTMVAIHFDDCYRDVRQYAAPLLAAASIPGTAFVSSGFVDTTRAFLHDVEKYPHQFANLSSQDLSELAGFGVDIAAHTVNHVDLGKIENDKALIEVMDSRGQLETLTRAPVTLFSFPFGGFHNIREEVRQMVAGAGYRALFSAHGGYLGPETSLFDIPRFGVSSEHSALALLLELEGLSLSNLKRWMRTRTRGSSFE